MCHPVQCGTSSVLEKWTSVPKKWTSVREKWTSVQEKVKYRKVEMCVSISLEPMSISLEPMSISRSVQCSSLNVLSLNMGAEQNARNGFIRSRGNLNFHQVEMCHIVPTCSVRQNFPRHKSGPVHLHLVVHAPSWTRSMMDAERFMMGISKRSMISHRKNSMKNVVYPKSPSRAVFILWMRSIVPWEHFSRHTHMGKATYQKLQPNSICIFPKK